MATLMISALFTLMLAALVAIALRLVSARGRFERPTSSRSPTEDDTRGGL
jgi:hypothetical protein